MAPRPRISVVVPVFNGARDLGGCLESIRVALTRVPRSRIEVIVCDNWSTDASREIAERAGLSCDYRIMRPAQHEPNRTRNWRAGLAQARADWMMMLHADDVLAPGGLAALLRAIERPEAERATLIGGRHRTFREPGEPDGGLHPYWPATSLLPGSLLVRSVLPLHCPFVPFLLMRRKAYEAVDGLDERWELVQDWELWMRLLGRGDVLFVPDEIGWWRVHPTSPRYREINAREHVELARRVAPRALPVALARAAVHLDGLDADTPWLNGDRLPTVDAANASLRRTLRLVSARLYALRAVGVVRRVL
ncbi:glycosyltransferase [Solirubrobacter ginsenosidimutans]|uniref:Glycosyltransferase n=1 Tax=Solirubrobacter ginsenosidimutans TaxID=490573 RepID=A0A9X3MWA7_9ACTN|nr:glycosyltransferase [Solirubrobacter ginsenosidimutans]MDA0163869.1 glycosyltransferase [Solirubrobacter ginsenosidimutans]